MPGWFAPVQPMAPRLHYRRQAQLIFPWGMLLCTVAICAYSRWIGVYGWPGSLWAALAGAAWLIYEILAPHSLLGYHSYRLFYRITGREPLKGDLNSQDQYYSPYPKAALFKNRHQLIWILMLLIVLATWGLVLVYGADPAPVSPVSAWLLPGMLILYSTVPFSILAFEAMGRVGWGQLIAIWIGLIALGAAVGALAAAWLSQSWLAAVVSGILVFFVFSYIYLNQRLRLGESVIGQVIRDISMRVLSIKDVPRALQEDIPGLIGQSLRYDRVAILLRDSNLPELTVVGTWGNYSKSFIGAKFRSSSGGLTWRAVERKGPIVWNDIRQCPYYLCLLENRESDDTRAEISVPLMHLGEVYGILDVQSRQPGLYGPGDVDILQTIAQILASAIASYKEEQKLIQAGELWEQLAASPNLTEEELFRIFASYAEEYLGVDVSIYYPLSPTGYPYKKPLTYGHLKRPEFLAKGITNPTGPLVRLINAWEYHPSTQPHTDPRYLNVRTNMPTPFIEREGIESSYFVPIGIKQEPLGALFLNFRTPKQFDNLFTLVIHSFSQAFATIIWKNRYRELIYESFGSPAFNIHFKRGNYGLKAGVSKEIEDNVLAVESDQVARINLERLKFITQRVDRFLDEIQFEEELIPPDFWRSEVSLQRQLVDFINSRPHSVLQGRATNVKLDFDYRIERENPIVKLAIFRVISEAISNAILHGQATNIQACVVRREDYIEIQVTNDGEPLPKDFRERPARMTKGIIYLIDKLEKGFGADTVIRPLEDGKGAIVQISIPNLPNTVSL